ncbi:stage III sporulation protein AG [Vulcanibacillus modesticaldus]|uniref:Stage III sporulation protein AG n=1 Tax=Vulcanibacillus modesticaldus TaxID=337097 RepID=A0A1D2YRU0_9BACI|nr:stage III sporulation protein AG [Vulcanibacillus modesticaldus]OEF95513.1 stage III sporulation protein AG [Vulcanibacillus modesticaldus]
MDKDKNSDNWFTWLIGGENDNKRMKIYRLLLFILIGIAIMIFSSFIGITEQVAPYESNLDNQVKETSGLIDRDSKPKTMQEYEKLFENQLTEILTDMIGVKEVTVKVNLDSTEEIIYEKDIDYSEQITKEKDSQGGIREISDINRGEQVVLYRTDDGEQPLVIKTVKPKVRGVVIVAKGAENIKIKAMITEAVQRLLDVPPYKIAILPRKS